MIKLALFGLFCLQAALAVSPSQALLEEWEAWKQEHGKRYSTSFETEAGLGQLSQEESFRMKIWMENKAFIEKHNRQFDKGHHTFNLAMNQFGDLSDQELFEFSNGVRPGPEEIEMDLDTEPEPPLAVNNGSVPESIDWREKGAVTPVKNQLGCGSCWAFAAVGALEGQLAIKHEKLIRLSEQELVDCMVRPRKLECHGGTYDNAFAYVKKHKGLTTEESYPYQGVGGSCRRNTSDIAVRVRGFNKTKSGDEDALKQFIGTKGPIAVTICASKFAAFLGTGIFSDPGCGTKHHPGGAHSVLAFGYGRDQKTNQDFWLLKNSWGPKWGDQGYMKLARNMNNQIGVANDGCYPLVA